MEVNLTRLGPLVLPWSEKLMFAANFVARKVLGMRVERYVPDFRRAFDHFCLHAVSGWVWVWLWVWVGGWVGGCGGVSGGNFRRAFDHFCLHGRGQRWMQLRCLCVECNRMMLGCDVHGGPGVRGCDTATSQY